MIVCVSTINIGLTTATNDDSPPINRHIPSNVSSAERWYTHEASSFFHRRFCCSSIGGGSDDCLCIYIVAADRRLRWVYNRTDGAWLLGAIAYCTPTSNSLIAASLYGTAGVQSSAEYIQSICMMYNLYISKVSYSICYFIYTIRLSLLTLLVHQYLIRMHIGHEIIAPVSLPLVLPTATARETATARTGWWT